ncbi:kinesin-like protein KIN-8A isoform X1 [Primulina eburnea]|uniref:kinesin-like protein KIN-8A isoform X1 n=1 Tax=Primulina eburnea TaxID=1245227 RepID=UPI003C6C69C6
MPVSTRSQNSSSQSQNDGNQGRGSRAPKKDPQEYTQKMGVNPHHGLKEKMKALTLLYEQQKRGLKEPRLLTHPSVDLVGSSKRDEKENKILKNVMREFAFSAHFPYKLPPRPVIDDFKETKRSSTVVRKLSMGPNVELREAKKENIQEMGNLAEKTRSGVSRILVFVRLRPMSKKEKESGSKCCVRIVNRRDVYLTEFSNEKDYLRLKRVRGRHFTFDASFPESTNQREVYCTTTEELVEAVLQGRNGSVFCYGATGAGKTYTMLGTVENPGVMVLAIKDLFNKIRQRSFDGHHEVNLSYLEVYNETVRDLLSPGRPLVLREDKQGILAAGLTQYRAFSTDEVMALLQQGNLNRTTEPTRANETSSRSHAILQVSVEYRTKDALNIVVDRIGKLSLIDLAGSERAIATDQRTLRSLEGANINKSLLALSSCINALVEGKKHIPYRNSKLTQLLKDSLGGACNTVMIANIGPSSFSFGETQNTLHWADRAKEIRLKASEVNEEMQIPDSETDQAKLLLELQKENRELRVELARQQQKLLTIQAQNLALNSSPTPSTVSSLLSPAPSSCQPNEKRKPRSFFSEKNCFTPESKKKVGTESVRDLSKTVKALEAEIERLKKDHTLQIKQKDGYINELSRKVEALSRVGGGEGVAGVITRSRLKAKEPTKGDSKCPSHRFLSPAPTAKKRTFWDITAANSPSIATITGRKTRSHFLAGAAAPSMLLQVLMIKNFISQVIAFFFSSSNLE